MDKTGKTGKAELVTFKGMVDGVRIKLDDTALIFDILTELDSKIRQNKAFFGDGDCHISFGGRRLSAADRERLSELVVGLLPMSRVSFDGGVDLPQTDWVSEYKERAAKTAENAEKTEVSENIEKLERIADNEFMSIFRSNRARLYHGTVKAGVTIRSDGHLVLLGRVSEGASLEAAGNIIVLGGLYGTAHAGCNGHNGSYIIAFDMRPEGLAIAEVGQEYVYGGDVGEEPEPKTAETKTGFFDKFKRRTETAGDLAQPTEIEEFPAMALLKNNKIELDKFTVQDFTK